ncbi:MAG: hypothetical protein ACHQF3_07930 [Alphaproteobacteria bacterium]
MGIARTNFPLDREASDGSRSPGDLPVFIHTMWRGGGTYLWSKFRECQSTLAFYEPFNETLGKASRIDMLSTTSQSWASKHPRLTAPYMAEYAPLVTARGLPFFRKEFTAASYFLEPGASLPDAQRQYIASLLVQARRSGKRPVLGFSRSLGRLPGLARALDACHIALIRNPANQWLSSFRQCRDHGNDYFLVMHVMVAGQNQHHPLLRGVAQRYGIPRLERASFDEELDAYRAVFSRLDLEGSYRIFLAIFVAAYLEALPHSNLVIDLDAISASAAERRRVERRIHELSGIALDLADASMPSYPLVSAAVDFAACHADVLEDVAALGDAASRQPRGQHPAVDWAPLFVQAKLEQATSSYLKERYAGRTSGALPGGAPGDDSERRAALLRAQLSRALLGLAAAEARLQSVMRSRSWRATAPIRGLVDLMRATRSRWAGWLRAAWAKRRAAARGDAEEALPSLGRMR